jgi:LAO/AO transport system kinase
MIDLAQRVLAGDARALARALRHVDDRAPGYLDLLKRVFPETGRAYVVGVTGNPGAGKSTLTDRLIEGFRARGWTVGVIAVDPTSPYSGGAILGDRIRMQRHATDEQVFIRSVATRGQLGGLSRSTRDMVRVLDAWTCAKGASGVVLVETVGVGQDELEVTRTAHTTLVVMAPGMGDEVQALKAGIMESADVFCVNKADKDGADACVRDIELVIALGKETMIKMGKARGHVVHGPLQGRGGPGQAAGLGASSDDTTWTPPIVKCVATRGEGTRPLLEALDKHRAWLETSSAGRERRRARLAEEVRESLREALIDAAVHDLRAELDAVVAEVESRAVDPYTATERLLLRFRPRP